MTDQSIKIVRNIAVGLLVIIAFLFAISISSVSAVTFWQSLGVQLVMLVISVLIYTLPGYQDSLIGIPVKTIGKCLFWGILAGILYLVILTLLPGLAIATPLLPGAISHGLKVFTICFIAPITESLFFLGVLLGYIQYFNPNKKQIIIAVLIQALLFSLAHVGAYIFNFYELPAGAGFAGLSANISVFISAFIFGTVSGLLVSWYRFRSLLIAIVMHMIINISVVFPLAVSIQT